MESLRADLDFFTFKNLNLNPTDDVDVVFFIPQTNLSNSFKVRNKISQLKYKSANKLVDVKR